MMSPDNLKEMEQAFEAFVEEARAAFRDGTCLAVVFAVSYKESPTTKRNTTSFDGSPEHVMSLFTDLNNQLIDVINKENCNG